MDLLKFTAIAAAGFVIASFSSGQAAAQTNIEQYRTWCFGTAQQGVSTDLQLSGCTALIQSGTESADQLARDFLARGISYDNSGQYARAIMDFDQAIALNPGYAEAYADRAESKLKSGDTKGADADYARAHDLDPQQYANDPNSQQ